MKEIKVKRNNVINLLIASNALSIAIILIIILAHC